MYELERNKELLELLETPGISGAAALGVVRRLGMAWHSGTSTAMRGLSLPHQPPTLLLSLAPARHPFSLCRGNGPAPQRRDCKAQGSDLSTGGRTAGPGRTDLHLCRCVNACEAVFLTLM